MFHDHDASLKPVQLWYECSYFGWPSSTFWLPRA